MATGAIARGGADGAGDGLAAVDVRGAAAEGGGVGGAGALEWDWVAAAGAAALDMDGGGPPGASVGSFIVGADVGLGGKLIRTVSFFGWTFEASAGLGGSAPPGDVGKLSGISFLLLPQPKVASAQCQTRIAISQSIHFIEKLPLP
jgi:hypothetical protein